MAKSVVACVMSFVMLFYGFPASALAAVPESIDSAGLVSAQSLEEQESGGDEAIEPAADDPADEAEESAEELAGEPEEEAVQDESDESLDAETVAGEEDGEFAADESDLSEADGENAADGTDDAGSAEGSDGELTDGLVAGEDADAELADGEEKAEEDEEKADAKDSPAFEESQIVDGVVVTVQADEGTFPAESKLQVKTVSAKVEAKVADAVDEVRDTSREVAASYTFDIKVLDKDGKEIQPADENHVHVSFKTEEVTEETLVPEVYHIADLKDPEAEVLEIQEKGDTVIAEVNGFSTYTLYFYDASDSTGAALSYVIAEGTTEVSFADVMSSLQINGKIYDIQTSNSNIIDVVAPTVTEKVKTQTVGEVVEEVRDDNNQVVTETIDATNLRDLSAIEYPPTDGSQWNLAVGSEAGTARITLSLFDRPTYYIDVVSPGHSAAHEILLRHVDGTLIDVADSGSCAFRSSECVEVYVTGYTEAERDALTYTYTRESGYSDFYCFDPDKLSTSRYEGVHILTTGTSQTGYYYFGCRDLAARTAEITITVKDGSSQIATKTLSIQTETGNLQSDLNDIERSIHPIVLRVGDTKDLKSYIAGAGLLHFNCGNSHVTLSGTCSTISVDNDGCATAIASGSEKVKFDVTKENACHYHGGSGDQTGSIYLEVYVLDNVTADLNDSHTLTVNNLNEWSTYTITNTETGEVYATFTAIPNMVLFDNLDSDTTYTVTADRVAVAAGNAEQEGDRVLTSGSAAAKYSYTFNSLSQDYEYYIAAGTAAHSEYGNCLENSGWFSPDSSGSYTYSSTSHYYCRLYYRTPAVDGAQVGSANVTTGSPQTTTESPKIYEVTDDSITVEGVTGEVYSIDGGATSVSPRTAVFYDLPAGKYKIEEQVTGINFISASDSSTTQIKKDNESDTYDVIKTDQTAPSAPAIELTADNNIAVTSPNADYEYSIDSGTTWVTPTTSGDNVEMTFSDLTPGTTYTVVARLPESTYKNASAASDESDPVTVPKLDATLEVSMADWTYGATPSNPSVTGNEGNGEVTYAYKAKDADDSTYVADKPSNAGSYTVKASVPATASYNAVSATDDFTINKATPDSSLFNTNENTPSAASDLMYNGEAQSLVTAPDATAVPGGYTLMYSLDGESWSDNVPTGTDAGDYTVYYKYQGDSNHNDVSGGDFNVSISPKSVTLTWPTTTSLSYTGSEQTFEPAKVEGILEADSGSVSVTYTDSKKTAVGSYTAVAALFGDKASNYALDESTGSKEWSIEKASQDKPDINSMATTKDSPLDGVKNGSVTISSYDATAAPMEYSTDGGETWDPVPDSGVIGDGAYGATDGLDAGTEVQVRYKETVTAQASEAASVTVQAKDAQDAPGSFETVTASSATAQDGAIKDLKAGMEYATKDDNGSLVWHEVTADGDLTGLAAGTYPVRWAETADKGASPTVEVTVPGLGEQNPPESAPVLDSKTDASITVKAEAGQEYSIDGGQTWHGPADGESTVTFSGLNPATEYSVSTRMAATDTANPSQAGENKLTVTTDKSEQETPSAPTGVSATGPTTVVVNPADAALMYSIDGGKNWVAPVDGKVTFDGLSAGTQYEVVSYKPETETEKASGQSNPTSVTTPKNSATLEVVLEGWTYGQQANTPTVNGYSGDAAIVYEYKAKDADDSTYSTSAPTVAGTYTVRATAAETGSYYGASDTADFSIAKATGNASDFNTKDNTPVAVDPAPTYSGEAQNLVTAPAATALPDDYTLMYSLDGENWSEDVPTCTDAGTYTVHYMYKGDDNHEDVAGGTVTATIARKSVTLTWPENSSLTYNGSEQKYEPASVIGILDADKVSVTCTGNAGTKVGIYQTSTALEGDATVVSNYLLDPTTGTHAWSIVKTTQDKPEGVAAVDASSATAKDGKITGVKLGMEYCGSDSVWHAVTAEQVTAGQIEGLGAGAYKVRYAETETANASPEVEVTVGGKANQTAPASAPELESTTASSITVKAVEGQEYSIDGGNTWVKAEDGQATVTFTKDGSGDALKPAAEYSIVTRMCETGEANPSPASDPLVAKTAKAEQTAPLVAPDAKATSDATVEVTAVDGEEYILLDASGNEVEGITWTQPTEGKVTFEGLSPNTEYQVKARKAATDTQNESAAGPAKTVTTEKSANPNKPSEEDLGIAKDSALEGVDNGAITVKDYNAKAAPMEYSADGGSTWVAVPENGVIGNPADGATDGLEAGTYKLRYAETDTTKAGEAVDVVVPSKTETSAPTGLGSTLASDGEAADGSITGVAAGMEYRGSDGEWHTVTAAQAKAGKIEGLAKGTYEVRWAETAEASASLSANVEVGAKAAQEAPGADLFTVAKDSPEEGVENGAITVAGYASTASDKPMEYYDAVQQKWVALPEDGVLGNSANGAANGLPAGEYQIRYAGTSTTQPSGPTTITVGPKSAADAPTGLGSEQASTATASDGKITGAKAGMEYQVTADDGTKKWIAVEQDGDVENLPAGTYPIRWAETADSAASPAVEVTVGGKPTADAPTTAPELESKTASSITVKAVEGQEYSIDDGKTWVKPADSEKVVTFNGLEVEKEYEIVTRVAETDDSNASAIGAETLKVTTNATQNAPTDLTAVKATSNTAADGSIQGASDAMEYSDDNGATWNAVPAGATEIAGLKAGDYLVRYAAAEGKDAGEPAKVTVGVKNASEAPTIDADSVTADTTTIAVDPTKAGCEYVVTTSATAPTDKEWADAAAAASEENSPYYKEEGATDGTHTFTGLAAGTQYYVHVRAAGTDEANPSEPATVAAPTKPSAPNPASDAVTVNYAGESIAAKSEPAPGYQIKDDQGNWVTEIKPFTPGKEYEVRVAPQTDDEGNEIVPASDPATYPAPTRPNAPAKPEVTAVESALGEDADQLTVNNPDKTAQYAVKDSEGNVVESLVPNGDGTYAVVDSEGDPVKDGEGNAVSASIGDDGKLVIDGLQPNTAYTVTAQIPATENSLASEPKTSESVSTPKAMQETPDAPQVKEVTDTTVTVGNAAKGTTYVISDADGKPVVEVTATEDGELVIPAAPDTLEPNSTYILTAVNKAPEDDDDAADSATTDPVAVMTAKSAPASVKPDKKVGEAGNDGSVKGVDDTMEYSTDGGKTWTPVSDGATEITGLSAGEVQVRYEAVEGGDGQPSQPASPAAKVTVEKKASGQTPVDAKVVKTTSGTETITVNAPVTTEEDPTVYEYKLDDGAWVKTTEFTGLEPGTSHTLQVRKAETDTDMPSEPVEVTVATKPATPNAADGVIVDNAEETLTAKPGYEIYDPKANDGAGGWVKKIDPFTPGETYPVRVAADEEKGVPASEPANFTAPERLKTPDVPTVTAAEADPGSETVGIVIAPAEDDVVYTVKDAEGNVVKTLTPDPDKPGAFKVANADGTPADPAAVEKGEDGSVTVDGLQPNEKYTVEAQRPATSSNPASETAKSEPVTTGKAKLDPNALADDNKPQAKSGLTYDGTAQQLVDTPKSVPEGYTMQYGTKAEDGTITWSENIPTGTNADSYDVYVKYAGDASHEDLELEDPITVKIGQKEITADDVDLASTSFIYSGEAQGPIVTVKVDGTILATPADYTIAGAEATNVKDGNEVTVTGAGNYTGTVVKTFDIKPYKTSDADTVEVSFADGDDEFAYDGADHRPDPEKVTVKLNGKELVQGKDYDLVYPPAGQSVEAGGYEVKVVLKGNYEGETAKDYRIVPAGASDLTVEAAPTEFTYSGEPQGPVVTVKFGTTVLVEGDDYELSNATAIDKGEYEVTVVAKGNYAGSATAPYKINAYKTSENDKLAISFADGEDSFVYDGEQHKPTAASVKVTLNGKELVQGADYDLVYPEKSTDAGSYEVKAVLKGNYSGETAKGYKIEPKSLTAEGMAVTFDPKLFTYNGELQGPNVEVKDGDEALTEGESYTVTGAKATDANSYTVIVKGTGNYTGTVSETYTIDKATGNAEALDAKYKASAADPAPVYTGEAQDLVKAPESAEPPVGYTKIQYGVKDASGDIAWSDEVPQGTDAGDYPVYTKYVGDANHEDLVVNGEESPIAASIAKADPSVEAPVANSPVYSGEAQPLVTAGQTPDGKVLYSTDGQSWSEEVPTATDAGDYTVYYKVEGDANHNGAGPAELKATIGKAGQQKPGDEPAVKGKTSTSITVDPTVAGQEYVVVPKGASPEDVEKAWGENGKTSQDGEALTFDGLEPGTEYEVLTRVPGDAAHDPSEPTEPVAASTLRPAPEAGEGYTEFYPTELVEVEDGYEVRVVSPVGTEPSTWSQGEAIEPDDGHKYVPLTPGATYEVRKKADSPNPGDEPSEAATFTAAERPETPATPNVTAGPEAETGSSDTSITISPAEEGVRYTVKDEDGNVVKTLVPNEDGTYAVKDADGADAGTAEPNDKGEVVVSGLEPGKEYTVEAQVPATATTPASEKAVSEPVTTDKVKTDPASIGDEFKPHAVSPTPVYNGKDQALVTPPTATDPALPEGFTQVLYSTDGEHWGEGIPTGKDAKDSYPVYAKFVGDDAHEDVVLPVIEASIAKADPSVEAPVANSPVYSGEAQPLVTAGQTPDGKVLYSTDGQTWSEEVPTATDAGDYTVYYKVEGDANHNGAGPAELKATIGKAAADKDALTDANKATAVSPTPVYNCTDQPLVNAPEALPEGYDKVQYTTDGGKTWSDDVPTATDAGEYTVGVRYVGDKNHETFEGDSISAKIDPKPLTSDDVAALLASDSFIYSGAEQGPVVTVKDGSTILSEGSDYAIEGQTATEQGAHDITITGMGNYIGTVEASFDIKPYKASDADKVEVSFGEGDDEFAYDGADHRPDASKVAVKLNGKELVQGKDYDLVYPPAGQSVEAGGYEVKVVLKGNYEGETAKDYRIVPAGASDLAVEAAPTEFTYSGEPQGPAVTVKFGTTVLAEGKDYTLANAKKTDKGSYTLTVTGTGNYAGTKTVDYAIKAYPAGDDDKLDITFPDGDKDAFTYDGADHRPAADGVKVTLNGKELVQGTDYDLVYPEKSTDAGSYEVKAVLKGNYSGETAKGYKIEPKSLTAEDMAVTFDPKLFTYNGELQGPNVEVKDGDEALTEGGSYTVTGAKATDANTYTATVRGTGNYTGTVSETYLINKKDGSADALTDDQKATVNGGLVYTGEEQDIVDDPKELPEGYEKVQYSTSATGPWSDDVPTGTDAGEYPVYVQYVGDGNHGDFVAGPLNGEIAKAEPSMTAAKPAEDLVWTGEPQQLFDPLPTTDDGTIMYQVDGGEWSEEPPAATDAGVHTVAYKVVGDENHVDGQPVEQKVTIAKASQDAPESAPSVDEVTSTSITVDPTVAGQQYVVVPAGTVPTEDDWADGKTSQGGEALTFDGLEPGTDYEVLARVPGDAAHDPSEPTEPVAASTLRPAPEAGEGYTEFYPTELVEVEDGYEVRVVSPVGTEPSTWSQGEAIEPDDGHKYVPLTPGATYEVRKKADSPNPGDEPSEVRQFTAAERPDAPEEPIVQVKPEEGGDSTLDPSTSVVITNPDPAAKYTVEDADGNVVKTLTPNGDGTYTAKDADGTTIGTVEPNDEGGIVVDGLQPNTAYTVAAQIPATKDAPASDSVKTGPFTTEKAAQDPVNAEDIKTEAKPDSIQVTAPVQTEDDPTVYEYSIDGGETWSTNPVISPVTPGEDYELSVRKAGDDKSEPSEPTTVTVSTPKEAQVAPNAPKVEATDATTLTVKPAAADEEYSIDGGKTWVKPADGEEAVVFDGLEPATEYQVVSRKAETDTQNASAASEPAKVTTPRKDAAGKPDASKMTATPDSQIEGVDNGSITIEGYDADKTPMEYSTDGKNWLPVPENGVIGNPAFGATDGLEAGTVQVRYPGDATTHPSEAVEISVPAKATQDAPADLGQVKATGADKNDGAITGVKAGMEYSHDGGTTWTPVTEEQAAAGKIDGIVPGSYLVRYAETDEKGASPGVEVVVEAKGEQAAPESAPVLQSKDDGSITVKAEPGQEYSIDGGQTWHKPGEGEDAVTFEPLDPASEHEIITRMAETDDDNPSPASEPLKVTTDKADQSAPEFAPKANAKDPQTIQITPESGLEYSVDGGKTWTPAPADGSKVEIGGLTPGQTYEVISRKTADDTHNASEPSEGASVTLPKQDAAGVPDADSMTVTKDSPADGVNNGSIAIPDYDAENAPMEYTDGTTDKDGNLVWKPVPESGVIGNGADGATDGLPAGIYKIRYAGNDTTNPSAPVSVSIPSKDAQSAPTGLGDKRTSDADATDGAITGVTAGMEYSTDGGKTWTPVTDEQAQAGAIEGLGTGTYQVRKAETADAGASPATTVEVKAKEDQTAPENGPTVKETAPESITVAAVDGEEYSIDGGKTWMSPSDGASTVTFDSLEPNAEYSVVSRKAETDTQKASPASEPTTVTTPKHSQAAPAAAPAATATDVTTITVDPAVEGEEYSIDGGKTWVKPTDGKAVFDNLTPGEEYEVVSRVAGDDTHDPSATGEPTKVTTPKKTIALTDDNKPTAKDNLQYNDKDQPLVDAPKSLPEGCAGVQYSTDGGTTWSSDIPTGKDAGNYTVSVKYVGEDGYDDLIGDDVAVTLNAREVHEDSGVAPLTNSDGDVIDKNGNPLTEDGNGGYVDENGKTAEPVPSVMVVGTNAESSGNVQGQPSDLPDDSPILKVSTPTYDSAKHEPKAYNNADLTNNVPAELSEGQDFSVAYYAKDDVDENGQPKAGATPLNTEDSNADNYAFDAGEKVAVVQFSGNFAGTLTVPVKIEKRELHVVTSSATKTFDGTPLTASEPTVWVEGDEGVPDGAGLVSGQLVDVSVTGSQTSAGTSENVYEIRYKGETESTEGGLTAQSLFAAATAYAADNTGITEGSEEPTAKRGNYEEVAEAGTLTVQARSAGDDTAVKGDDDSKTIQVTPTGDTSNSSQTISGTDGAGVATYAGKPIAAPVLYDTSTNTQLVSGTDYDVTYYDADGNVVTNPTDAGTYRMVITYKGDYSGTYETSVVIEPAALTVKTPSAKKAYDGKALTKSEGAAVEGLVDGETVTLKVTGSQTKVGKSDNTYELVWDGSAKESNYAVASEDLGVLEVTKASSSATRGTTSGSSSRGTTSSSGGKTPATGDDLPWQPWAATAGMSVLAILAAGLRLRRREDGRRAKRNL